MNKPYYLLVEVLNDYGVPVDIKELVADMHDSRGIDCRISIMEPAISQVHTREDSSDELHPTPER